MKVDYRMTQEIIRLYRKGMTLNKVGAELGVSESTVLYTLKKNGIPRRGLTKYRYNLIEKMYDDYEDGMTLKAIAEKYGIPEGSAKTIQYKYGLVRKPRF